MGNSKNLKRKRKHHKGNQFNSKKSPNQSDDTTASDVNLTAGEIELDECSSSKKIKRDKHFENDPNLSYNFIMDFSILESIVHTISACKSCNSDLPLVVENNLPNRMGFALQMRLYCSVCSWSETFYTSKPVVNEGVTKVGRKPFAINLQMVAAFREIGKGFTPLDNFCRISNIQGMNKTVFDDINSKLMVAYKDVASKSMTNAAKEVFSGAEKTKDGMGLCRVSLDGSWQRRGHASLNGLVTTISDGKSIDMEVMTKFCRGCAMWQKRKGTPEYNNWKESHECVINHTKSSGAMEGAGAVKMFERSITQHNLVYHQYLGDGDTSSFKEVVEADPYQDQSVIPSKLECVGHVQKRLGTRLRKKVKDYSHEETVMKNGKKLIRKVKISGKGKLTDTMINSMQNYYGLAIRRNLGNLYEMKKAIGAVLYHCTQFDSPVVRHKFCPRGSDTWCKWQLDKINGTNKYKQHVGIPKWIHDVIHPIFVELRDDGLLSKCLHGQTQNPNEA